MTSNQPPGWLFGWRKPGWAASQTNIHRICLPAHNNRDSEHNCTNQLFMLQAATLAAGQAAACLRTTRPGRTIEPVYNLIVCAWRCRESQAPQLCIANNSICRQIVTMWRLPRRGVKSLRPTATSMAQRCCAVVSRPDAADVLNALLSSPERFNTVVNSVRLRLSCF